jgi:hypothetical protein
MHRQHTHNYRCRVSVRFIFKFEKPHGLPWLIEIINVAFLALQPRWALQQRDRWSMRPKSRLPLPYVAVVDYGLPFLPVDYSLVSRCKSMLVNFLCVFTVCRVVVGRRL